MTSKKSASAKPATPAKAPKAAVDEKKKLPAPAGKAAAKSAAKPTDVIKGKPGRKPKVDDKGKKKDGIHHSPTEHMTTFAQFRFSLVVGVVLTQACNPIYYSPNTWTST